MKKTYVCGLVIGGALASGVAYCSSPTVEKNIKNYYTQVKDAILFNWNILKEDLEEFISNCDWKDKAASLWYEKFPLLRERISQFQEEVEPFLGEVKELLLELQQLLLRIQEQLKNFRVS